MSNIDKSTHIILTFDRRWLILSGREDEALKVLSVLNDSHTDEHEIRQEFLQIKDAVIEMAQASFSNMFRMGDYRDLHRVILAVLLQFFQQIGGINFMTQYYAAMFMNQYLWEGWKARILAAGAGTTFFLASFVAVWCIDRICGRRALMLFGTSGMLFCMVILTIMLSINSRPALDAGTAFVFLFCICWAIGWQGMSWLYQVEIVPLRIRGPANALSTGANWLVSTNHPILFGYVLTFTGQFHRRVDRSHRLHNISMEVLSDLCLHQRRHTTHHLLPISRDVAPLSRGDRLHLPHREQLPKTLVGRQENCRRRASLVWPRCGRAIRL